MQGLKVRTLNDAEYVVRVEELNGIFEILVQGDLGSPVALELEVYFGEELEDSLNKGDLE